MQVSKDEPRNSPELLIAGLVTIACICTLLALAAGLGGWGYLGAGLALVLFSRVVDAPAPMIERIVLGFGLASVTVGLVLLAV